MILFVKHIDIEGPDMLAPFFKNKGLQTKTVELYNGEKLPKSSDDLDAVISLGGPMSVYDVEQYPFLQDEEPFIKQIVSKGIPFIGICLGSQLLAKACDAKVNKSPKKEIGFYPIEIMREGQNDPLFEGLSEKIDVFQWHEDMSELPLGATLLASSGGCPHQAYKIGSCAYGIQFHFEVTENTVRKWAEAYFSKDSLFKQRSNELVGDYQNRQKRFTQIADTINNNFLKIINKHKLQQV